MKLEEGCFDMGGEMEKEPTDEREVSFEHMEEPIGQSHHMTKEEEYYANNPQTDVVFVVGTGQWEGLRLSHHAVKRLEKREWTREMYDEAMSNGQYAVQIPDNASVYRRARGLNYDVLITGGTDGTTVMNDLSDKDLRDSARTHQWEVHGESERQRSEKRRSDQRRARGDR